MGADRPFHGSGSQRPESTLVSPREQERPARPRLLVVDDDEAVLRSLVRSLGRDSEVHGATNGAKALQLVLSDGPFDIILCDLLMPEMTGMDLYRELKSLRAGAESAIVFMTGGAFTPDSATFLRTVPNAHLEKPFDLDVFRAMLRGLR